MLFTEFDRGYDMAVGYLLAHEELLHEHSHGTVFSLDALLRCTPRAAMSMCSVLGKTSCEG